MKYKISSAFLSLVILFSNFGILFNASNIKVGAVTDEFNSYFTRYTLNHRSLYIDLSDSSSPYDSDNTEFEATALISVKDSKEYSAELRDKNAETEIRVSFIVNPNNEYCAEYNLDFPDNKYIEGNHYYEIKIYDNTEKIIARETQYFGHLIGVNYDESVFWTTSASVKLLASYKSVRLEINNDVYYKDLVSDDTIVKFNYPTQIIGEKVKCTVTDKCGCFFEYTTTVKDEFKESGFDFFTYEIDTKPTEISIEYTSNYSADISVRLFAKVNNQVYNTDYLDLSLDKCKITYPYAKPGTPIDVWAETSNGSVSEIYHTQIYDKKIKINSSGATYNYLSGYANVDLKKVYVEINGKKYYGEIEEDLEEFFSVEYKALAGDIIKLFVVDEDDYICCKELTIPKSNGKIKILNSTVYKTTWEFSSKTSDIKSSYVIINGHKYKGKEEIDEYTGSAEYGEVDKATYREKVNSKVTVYVETEDGGIYKKTASLKAVIPNLSIWKMYAGDKIIEGFTKENSSVTAKVGKKTYKTKSDKEGYYKIKTKGFKYKTRIKVTVNNETGCKNTKSITVEKPKGSIKILNTIYKGTKVAKVRITNAKKGDFIKLRFGNKAITKKIKKNYKKKNIVFKIDNLVAGKTVVAQYKDKYKTIKDSTYKRIYFGDSIYIGMSVKNAQLTTWGRPVRRNDYSSYLQWVFESGSSTLYAYIRNGVVFDIQRLNY